MRYDATPEEILENCTPAEFHATSYADWCAKFVERHVHVQGLCALGAAQAKLAFPELRIVRGFCRNAQHWWAVAPDGTIVDPTASQFGAPTPADYRPFDESRAHELPTGKCMNCGDFLYYHAQACTLECARALHAEFNGHLDDAELDEALRRTRVNPIGDPERPCYLARLQPFFTFYGGKWRLAPRYPPPKHATLIEPFAGGAGYALTYPERRVILNEANPRIAALWRYLTRVTVVEILSLPDVPLDGTVDDLHLHQEARDLIGFWCNKSCALPATQPSSWMRSGRYPDQFWGPAIRERLARQVGSIAHWTIREGSYFELPLERASWFVDPPYQVPADTPKRRFPAGAQYSPSARKIDFTHLGAWCRALPGQVIVCEHPRATWLPFEPFFVAKGLRKEAAEAIWLHDDDDDDDDVAARTQRSSARPAAGVGWGTKKSSGRKLEAARAGRRDAGPPFVYDGLVSSLQTWLVPDGRIIAWPAALPGRVCEQQLELLPLELHGGPHVMPELARALAALVEPWLFALPPSWRWRDEVTFTMRPLGWHRDAAGAQWKVAIYLDELASGGTLFDRDQRIAPPSPRGTVVAFSPAIEHCSADPHATKRVLGLRADSPGW